MRETLEVFIAVNALTSCAFEPAEDSPPAVGSFGIVKNASFSREARKTRERSRSAATSVLFRGKRKMRSEKKQKERARVPISSR